MTYLRKRVIGVWAWQLIIKIWVTNQCRTTIMHFIRKLMEHTSLNTHGIVLKLKLFRIKHPKGQKRNVELLRLLRFHKLMALKKSFKKFKYNHHIDFQINNLKRFQMDMKFP